MNIAVNEYYYVNSISARAQEIVQMDQMSLRVTHNQPLAPGYYEESGYLNDAEIREITAQELIRRPKHKKCRICYYGLITIFFIFLFSSAAFYICESIIKSQNMS